MHAEQELFGLAGESIRSSQGRRGALLEADGGTLFLEDVSDTFGVQAKLVQALESGEVVPVGGDQAQQFHVVVSATTGKLLSECRRATFARTCISVERF